MAIPINDAHDLVISAYCFAEERTSGRSTSWIYVCTDPDSHIEGLVKGFFTDTSISYVGMCYELNKFGRWALIAHLQFKAHKSFNTIFNRHKFGRGVLLAKKLNSVMPYKIANWMKGPYTYELTYKPRNETFVEFRPTRPDKAFRGERDVDMGKKKSPSTSTTGSSSDEVGISREEDEHIVLAPPGSTPGPRMRETPFVPPFDLIVEEERARTPPRLFPMSPPPEVVPRVAKVTSVSPEIEYRRRMDEIERQRAESMRFAGSPKPMSPPPTSPYSGSSSQIDYERHLLASRLLFNR